MPKQIIVLEVEWLSDENYRSASEWDWTDMVGDDCTVIAVGLVTE